MRRGPTEEDWSAAATRLSQIYAVELGDGIDLEDAIAELREDPHVAFVQQDHTHELDYEPNDPYLATSGSWGQSFDDLWALDRIGAFEAWDRSLGANQVVAVVDTGVDYEHPDLADNLWVNPGEDLDGNGRVDPSDWNGVDDDGNGFVDDLRGYDFAGFGSELPDGTISEGDPDPFDEVGHGTHVAGTIAAVANNGLGIVGVAPESRVMALKGFAASGSGRDSDLWRAVLYAIENGARVVNASWSCSPACPDNPLAREVLVIAESAGVVFVTSAGNSSADVIRNEPERTTAAITVGSIGEDDQLSYFSNRGWLIDIVAPGGGPAAAGVRAGQRNILSLAASTLPEVEEVFLVGDQYYRLAGTSMAAPHVAGAVALLLSIQPELSTSQVRRQLRSTARDLGLPGLDPLHGPGALDVARLLDAPFADVDLAFVAPGPGTLHDPNQGPLVVSVRGSGTDVVRLSLAVSRGLSNRNFTIVDEWSPQETGVRKIPWTVASLDDGPYVLRLRAVLTEGDVIDEMNVVALERTHPIRLSRGSFTESEPSIHGRRVAWETKEGPRGGPSQISLGGFVAGGRVRQPVRLAPATEASQRTPIVDGRRVVWLEHENPPDGPEERLMGCRILDGFARQAGRSCESKTLTIEPQGIEPFGFARNIAIWSRRTSVFELLTCRWRRSGSCSASLLNERLGESGSARLLDFDGHTALWRLQVAGRGSLQFCAPVWPGKACEPKAIQDPFDLVRFADSASLDGSLVALELFFVSGSSIAYCQLDRSTGDCPLVFVEGVDDGRKPRVSGRRIVWTEYPAGQDSVIAMCEVDGASGECPRKQLTGSPMAARTPVIDRNRVVFADERRGPSQIFALHLPDIWARAKILARPRRSTRLPIFRRDAGAFDLKISLEAVRGPTPESYGAVVHERSDGSWLLHFRATPKSSESSAIWRLRAFAPNGLETARLLEIVLPEIEHAPRRKAASSARGPSRTAKDF